MQTHAGSLTRNAYARIVETTFLTDDLTKLKEFDRKKAFQMGFLDENEATPIVVPKEEGEGEDDKSHAYKCLTTEISNYLDTYLRDQTPESVLTTFHDFILIFETKIKRILEDCGKFNDHLTLSTTSWAKDSERNVKTIKFYEEKINEWIEKTAKFVLLLQKLVVAVQPFCLRWPYQDGIDKCMSNQRHRGVDYDYDRRKVKEDCDEIDDIFDEFLGSLRRFAEWEVEKDIREAVQKEIFGDDDETVGLMMEGGYETPQHINDNEYILPDKRKRRWEILEQKMRMIGTFTNKIHARLLDDTISTVCHARDSMKIENNRFVMCPETKAGEIMKTLGEEVRRRMEACGFNLVVLLKERGDQECHKLNADSGGGGVLEM